MTIEKIEKDNPHGIDTEKVENAYTKLVSVFKEHKLNVREILTVYGNLGYTLGASIGGYKDTAPNEIQLKQLYYSKPTIDVALMMQGIITTTWVDDLTAAVENVNKEEKEEDNAETTSV